MKRRWQQLAGGILLSLADMLGTTLAGYVRNVVWEVRAFGRGGSLVGRESGREPRSLHTTSSGLSVRGLRVSTPRSRASWIAFSLWPQVEDNKRTVTQEAAVLGLEMLVKV
jgi:hypothetical protein